MLKPLMVAGLIAGVSLLQACTTTGPIDATSIPVGNAEGKACAETLFGFYRLSGEDPTIYNAAKNGGIKKISTVDSDGFDLFVYDKYCAVVHGYK